MLNDTIGRLFENASEIPIATSDGWHDELWHKLSEIGVPLLLVAEEAGGIGGNWEDAFVVQHAVGAHGVALPVGETMLAACLATAAGLELHSGPLGLVPNTVGRLDGIERSGTARFSGEFRGVPWGRHLQTLVAVVAQGSERYVIAVPRASAHDLLQHCNLAGEPRDRLRFDGALVFAARSSVLEAQKLNDFCALLRVGQISGALESVLARSIQYAKDRSQFGRSIAAFQAVQHELALLGEETAAASCAARAAFRAADRGDPGFEISAAKLRANLAIGTCTAIAHQVHGAIGFTREYPLRRFTQRLWSWRTEFGSDRDWSERVGAIVAARGADAFWADLSRRDQGVCA